MPVVPLDKTLASEFTRLAPIEMTIFHNDVMNLSTALAVASFRT